MTKYDDRITILYDSGVTDSIRGRTDSWTTLATVWAEVIPLKDEKKTVAAQRGMYATHRITVRYKPTMPMIAATCPGKALRVSYGGKTYEVNDKVDEDNQHIKVIMTCGEIKA